MLPLGGFAAITTIGGLADAGLAAPLAGADGGRVRAFETRRPRCLESFDGFDTFVARTTSADPARNHVVARDRARIEEAFHRVAVQERGLRWLDQPLKADALARR